KQFTAQRAKLARYRAKLARVPAGTTFGIVCTFRTSYHTPMDGWTATSRASTSGMRSSRLGGPASAPPPSAPMRVLTAADEMSYVEDAFANLKGQLEITNTESELAQRRHKEIRDHVASEWELEDDFLTGSYRRHTKTKKLKDVDIFVVVKRDGAQGHLRDL